MMREGFAVVGCPRCRRMQVADLSHATKICACGYKMSLSTIRMFAVSSSAEEAGGMLRSISAPKNSGFVPAVRMQQSLTDKKKDD